MNKDEFLFRQNEKNMALAVKHYKQLKISATQTQHFKNSAWYKKLLWIIIK